MLARARAFVYYFNTERNAVYCVLYVFLFILYNTVFFIVEPCRGARVLRLCHSGGRP